MLYAWREWQSMMWAPALPWLQATAELLAKVDHITHAAPCRQVAAGCDLLVRLFRHYDKPQFGLTYTDMAGQRVAVRESVVLEKAFCRLVRFERATDCRHPVVLLVAPLSGHHATLLRDTVRAMLPDFDVYITDWLDARHVPVARGTFHLHDYVAYVQEFIDYLGPEVHVVAVCQSTVPVLGAIALSAAGHGCTPASVTLMGGPVDARRSPTVVNRLAVSKPLDWFARTLINTVPRLHAGAGREVYPGFRQHMAFMSMNPDRHLKAHADYYRAVSTGNTEAARKHRTFYDEYNAVLDMAAEYYLETVRVVFQDFALARGTWTVNGERVCPEAIRDTVLITVEGENDDICGQGQTHAAHDLCTAIDPSNRYCLTVAECGHYGIFSGSRWRTHIYPRIRDIIRRFDNAHPEATASETVALNL
ncbi:poly(3-hydroxybutyrate) depolymerase [Paraburkholderia diazotrophica]|uniref:Poly(3-hydroxybutyrate) depolymerase n=2 Tax=Paraburkholderia diazotrophica TaxID=667676 RepID=A0A1H7EK70_9BURK|nr:poly(3-hydroxybutyrate) depolymerase [Paraburkholderia diazotrophica]